MTVFVPLSTQPVLYQGRFVIGAQITAYDAGTLTPRTVYADALQSATLLQPILSDGNACIPEMWVAGNPYRIRVMTPAGQLIRDIDNLPADTAGPAPPPPPTVSKPVQTGDIILMYGTAIVPGRVRVNGKTIGNIGSGATEYYGADAQDLFEFLWNLNPNSIVGTPGLSANLDWLALKQLTLPNANGCAFFCIDGMGSPVTGRLNGGLFVSGDSSTLGSIIGEATHISTTIEMPLHNHTGTALSGGSHQHTGTTALSTLIDLYGSELTDSAGTHSHGATTGSTAPGASSTGYSDSIGQHQHSGATDGENVSHSHQYVGLPASTYTANPGSAFGGAYYGSGQTLSTGAESNSHSHTFTTNVAGQHQHILTISTTISNHAHAIGPDGAHQHYYHDTTYPHTHVFTTDAGGAHSHTLSINNTGGGGAHNNLPPGILVTAYMVL